MTTKVYLVPIVDTDPRYYNNCLKSGKNIVGSELSYEKWGIEQAIQISRKYMEKKTVFQVHTSPLFRNEYFRPSFFKLWGEIVAMGGELVLHPHEEKLTGGTYWSDREHMEKIIKDATLKIRNFSLPIFIFRSGHHAWSQYIPEIFGNMEYKIDFSCAQVS